MYASPFGAFWVPVAAWPPVPFESCSSGLLVVGPGQWCHRTRNLRPPRRTHNALTPGNDDANTKQTTPQQHYLCPAAYSSPASSLHRVTHLTNSFLCYPHQPQQRKEPVYPTYKEKLRSWHSSSSCSPIT